ncbi:MAG: phosphoethanolamine transferase [Acidaminococcus sp.]|jgi:heptose-I-phosphate ethanolaminephosphotransferase|nr:phosphoethanolamine transferase [Acidaminococcus sp.]MCI2100027.1 phosphoethanolamine transferase [Acidaminococcus sp.]MCI2114293.1 phosphoethanolamine transferase [Acidaminococcus sp.]MCI2116902.1 phosphoethanolamine transferase [Acidaminococcus sp.]
MNHSINHRSLIFFIAALFCHMGIAFGFRLTGQLEQRLFNEILLYGALAFSVTWALWKYHKTYLIHFIIILILYLLSVYLLRDFSNNGLAASEAIELGTSLFSLSALLGTAAVSLKHKFTHGVFLFLFYAGMIITAGIPLLGLGYGFISGGNALSSDLVLAVFQTNPREAIAFLEDQPLSRWAVAIFALFLFLFLEVKISHKMLQNASVQKWLPIVVTGALLILNIKSSVPRLHTYYLANTIVSTRRSLNSYKSYRKHQKERLDRLRNLTDLTILPEAKGTYVLIIGESASRDHMHAYGYERENTPWMDRMKEVPGTTLFKKAYANYCQTVPALTYALSGKNQYNDVNLEDAYSIIEIAKAAGYETYWLSNQARFSVAETPVSEMASTADHQIWLNGRSSSPTEANYPDKDLVSYLPDSIPDTPTLIVLHIMGNHGKYADRYPKNFEVFKGKGRRLDGYDNSILYVDSVLKSVFEKTSRYPNFKGFIYMPDHGEHPEDGRTHQPDKFTYQMVHIPLMIYLPPSNAASRPVLYETAKSHVASPWTNDLLYDAMIDLLGIQNAPFTSSAYSIFSPDYHMTRQNLLTQHGQKTLEDDPDQGSGK